MSNPDLLFFFNEQWSNRDKVQENTKGDISVPQNDGKNHCVIMDWFPIRKSISIDRNMLSYEAKYFIFKVNGK